MSKMYENLNENDTQKSWVQIPAQQKSISFAFYIPLFHSYFFNRYTKISKAHGIQQEIITLYSDHYSRNPRSRCLRVVNHFGTKLKDKQLVINAGCLAFRLGALYADLFLCN
jgi:hypothetical protein